MDVSVSILSIFKCMFAFGDTQVYVPRWAGGHVPSSSQPYFRVQVEAEWRSCTVIRFQWGHRRIRPSGKSRARGHLAQANSCQTPAPPVTPCHVTLWWASPDLGSCNVGWGGSWGSNAEVDSDGGEVLGTGAREGGKPPGVTWPDPSRWAASRWCICSPPYTAPALFQFTLEQQLQPMHHSVTRFHKYLHGGRFPDIRIPATRGGGYERRQRLPVKLMVNQAMIFPSKEKIVDRLRKPNSMSSNNNESSLLVSCLLSCIWKESNVTFNAFQIWVLSEHCLNVRWVCRQELMGGEIFMTVTKLFLASFSSSSFSSTSSTSDSDKALSGGGWQTIIKPRTFIPATSIRA